MTTLRRKLPMILALDPGGTTGICLYNDADPVGRVEIDHLGPEEHHDVLWEFLAETLGEALKWKVTLHIVCEQFEFRQTERHRDFINYIPREYIGVVKLFHMIHKHNTDTKLFMQSAAQAKGFFDDVKVKKLGLWVPGRQHAMDATRHYLYHRVFTLNEQSMLQELR